MRRIALFLIGGLLAALATVTAVHGAATSQAIGTVLDALGHPIPGAVVTLLHAGDGRTTYDGKSDKQGRFMIDGILYVPPGEWKVSVKAEGFAPSRIKVESKTKSAVVANFEEAMQADGTPKLVPIRPFATARIDFVLIPADQVPAAARTSSGASAGVTDAGDPIVQAAERVERGDLPGAVPFFEKAIEAKPDDAERRLEYAKLLLKLENYDDAEAQAKKAVELAPARPGSNQILAIVYHATDRYDLAAAAAKKERQISPNDPAVLAMVAKLAEDSGHLSDAVEANEAIVALDPKNSRAWLSLGDLYSRTGKPDRSADAFKKVADIDPAGAYETFYNIGALIMNKPDSSPGETRKAIEAFKKAIEIKPDYVAAHRQLAYALLSVGDLDQARSSIERYLELDANSSEAKNLRDVLKGLPKPKAAAAKP